MAELVGVFYCIAHEGVANEDDRTCDFFDPDEHVQVDADGEPIVDEDGELVTIGCDFRQCMIDRDPKAKVDR
jgi:hypothetical protein